jgi:hypothetical protein
MQVASCSQFWHRPEYFIASAIASILSSGKADGLLLCKGRARNRQGQDFFYIPFIKCFMIFMKCFFILSQGRQGKGGLINILLCKVNIPEVALAISYLVVQESP